MKLTQKKAVLIYVLVALFLCFEMAVQVSPGVITNELMRDFKINAFWLGFMSSVYFYSYTAMQIPAGLLFDRFKLRTVIIVPLLVCSFGTYLFSFANTVLFGSLARLLMGCGSAFAFIAVLVTAANVFDRKYFAFLAGVTQMLAAVGAMSGNFPLNRIVDCVGWRTTMQGLTYVGVALAFAIWFFVRYEDRSHYKKDSSCNRSALESLKSIVSKSQTWIIALYACLLWAPMAVFASLWGRDFFVKAYNLSSSNAAILVSLMWVGIAVGSPIFGWWLDRSYNRKTPLFVTALIGLISFSIVILGWNLPIFFVGLFTVLAGAACSGQALSFALVRDNNQNHDVASAIGFNNMAVVISGAIFQPLVSKLIQSCSKNVIQDGVPVLVAQDYRYGLSVIVICYFVGTVVSLFFIKDKKNSCCHPRA